MKKPWSITTTVRNPERLRDFLIALQPLEGKTWDKVNQQNYQKLLIKNRLYGFGNSQFYNGLSKEIVDLVNDRDQEIDDKTVIKIIKSKNYVDFDMRGRQSVNPLKKFGFVIIENDVLKITDLGRKLIASEKDSGDAFLKSFIKWQIPNPANDDFADNGDYGAVPFVASLKLIHEVNNLVVKQGGKPVGLQKREFALFAPSLVKYTDIQDYAKKVLNLRELQQGKNNQERKAIRDEYRQKFAREFLGSDNQKEIDKFLKNLQDYGDNAVRYFRLTKFIRIRGNGFYVDLEPNRKTEIDALFEREFYKPKTFANTGDYLTYMSDDSLPVLPWQTREKLLRIAENTIQEVSELQRNLNLPVSKSKDTSKISEEELNTYVRELREERKNLQEKANHIKSQPVEAIDDYIKQLQGIYHAENRPLMLEYLSTMGLHALNDAREIKPNYPVGDDNEPTNTAPGGMADIECYYSDFNMICEVTMLKGRDQWFNEGQPVMRHLRDFENRNENSYCLFIAPTIHADSAETFFVANNYGYKGQKQHIAPITINQFIELLITLKKVREVGKKFTHDKLQNLVKDISNSSLDIADSDEWISGIQKIIAKWDEQLSVSENNNESD